MNYFKKAMRRVQEKCLKIRLSLHDLMGIPAQLPKEKEIFKAVFDSYAGRDIQVFEWGSGISTIYYGKYLMKRRMQFSWHAVDNHRGWYDKVTARIGAAGLKSNINVYLKEFSPFWMKPGWGKIPPPCGMFAPKLQEEKEYIDLPNTLKIRFDIIIIDARFRRRCLEVAKTVLKPDGVVIIHDAQKDHYRVGTEDFRHAKLIDSGRWYSLQGESSKIWVGTFGNPAINDILSKF